MKNSNIANIEKLPMNTKILRSRKIIQNENPQIPKKRNLDKKEEVRKFGKDIKNCIDNLKLPKSKTKTITSSQRIPTEKSNEENEKFKVIFISFFLFFLFSL